MKKIYICGPSEIDDIKNLFVQKYFKEEFYAKFIVFYTDFNTLLEDVKFIYIILPKNLTNEVKENWMTFYYNMLDKTKSIKLVENFNEDKSVSE